MTCYTSTNNDVQLVDLRLIGKFLIITTVSKVTTASIARLFFHLFLVESLQSARCSAVCLISSAQPPDTLGGLNLKKTKGRRGQ